MNRNVTILIIILIILLIAGYLLWLRSRFQKINNEPIIVSTTTVSISQTPQPTIGVIMASPSATPSAKVSPIAAKTRTSTSAGSKVK